MTRCGPHPYYSVIVPPYTETDHGLPWVDSTVVSIRYVPFNHIKKNPSPKNLSCSSVIKKKKFNCRLSTISNNSLVSRIFTQFSFFRQCAIKARRNHCGIRPHQRLSRSVLMNVTMRYK